MPKEKTIKFGRAMGKTDSFPFKEKSLSDEEKEISLAEDIYFRGFETGDLKQAIKRLIEDIDRLEDRKQFTDDKTNIWIQYKEVIQKIKDRFGEKLT